MYLLQDYWIQNILQCWLISEEIWSKFVMKSYIFIKGLYAYVLQTVLSWAGWDLMNICLLELCECPLMVVVSSFSWCALVEKSQLLQYFLSTAAPYKNQFVSRFVSSLCLFHKQNFIYGLLRFVYICLDV